MKSLSLKLCLIFFSFIHLTYSQNYEWTQQFGGTETSVGQSIITDNLGNIYSTGIFTGTVNFDEGTSFTNGDSPSYNSYIIKSDSSGNIIWAKRIVNKSNSNVLLATDSNGNLYITAKFNGKLDFDTTENVFNETSNSALITGTFIMKLTPEGNLIWAEKIDGSAAKVATISIDNNDNIILFGEFNGTVDFDMSEGVYEYTLFGGGGFFGSSDVFISKYDSESNFIWAKQIGNESGEESSSMAIDNLGNIYISGQFLGETDLDPSDNIYPFQSYGERDIYISKFDPAGNFVWANQIGGTGEQTSNAMVFDSAGDLYITGYVQYNVDFDSSENEYILSGSDYDAFITKVSSNGEFIWAKRFNGPGWSYGRGIAVDNSNDVYITGNFFGTTDFDPNGGEYNLESTGVQDITGDYNIFSCKLSSQGDFAWAHQLEGDGWNFGNSITVDDDFNVYATGHFEGTIDFDPSESDNIISPINNYDAFTVKFSQDNLSVEDNEIDRLRFYPNPTEDFIYLSSNINISDISLFDINGHKIILRIDDAKIDMRRLSSGVYFLKVQTENGIEINKIIKE